MPVYIFEPLIENGKKVVREPKKEEWFQPQNVGGGEIWHNRFTVDSKIKEPIFTRLVCQENPMGPIIEAFEEYKDDGLLGIAKNLFASIEKAVKIYQEGEV